MAVTHMMQRGFTLPEVLISIIILGVGISGIYTLYIGIADSLLRAQERTHRIELLMSAGQYALIMSKFPTDAQAKEPVTFTYDEQEFIITPQKIPEEALSARAQLGTYRLSLKAQDQQIDFLTYLMPLESTEEKPTPAAGTVAEGKPS